MVRRKKERGESNETPNECERNAGRQYIVQTAKVNSQLLAVADRGLCVRF